MSRLASDDFQCEALHRLEEDILRRTQNQREEVAFLSRSGEVIFSKVGEADRIILTAPEIGSLIDRVDLFTHNHPSGGSLTWPDLSLAVFLNAREVDAFGYQFRYRLGRSGEAWPDVAYLEERVRQLREQVRSTLQRRVNALRLTPAAASDRFWHEVWLRLRMEIDGVTYRRETR